MGPWKSLGGGVSSGGSGSSISSSSNKISNTGAVSTDQIIVDR